MKQVPDSLLLPGTWVPGRLRRRVCPAAMRASAESSVAGFAAAERRTRSSSSLDPLQRHLCPAAPERSPRGKLAPAWSTPSATRCRAWWKSTRPAWTKDDPPSKDAATTARCSSSAPSNSGTETSQAACGWRNLLLRRPGHFVEPPIPSHRENRRLVGYAAVPADGVGDPPRPWIHQVFASKDGREASTGCVASICRPISMSSSFANRRRPACCFPLALPPRHQCRTPYACCEPERCA